jgi:hypothetical protein
LPRVKDSQETKLNFDFGITYFVLITTCLFSQRELT